MSSDFHDANDARRYRARQRRQRRYQAEYRAKLSNAGAPQKADFAKACLDELLLVLARNPNSSGAFVERVLNRLSSRFETEEVARRFAELVRRAAAHGSHS